MASDMHSLWSACSSHRTEAYVLWRSMQFPWPDLHRDVLQRQPDCLTRAWLPYRWRCPVWAFCELDLEKAVRTLCVGWLGSHATKSETIGTEQYTQNSDLLQPRSGSSKNVSYSSLPRYVFRRLGPHRCTVQSAQRTRLCCLRLKSNN